jgi:hypothetical protein
MDLEFILLADKAEGINGKLYILGGGWDRIFPHTLPSIVTYDVVISLRFTKEEQGDQILQVVLEDQEGGRVLGPLGGPISLPDGSQGGRVQVVLGGPFPVQRYGTYRWVVSVNDKPLGHITFEVAEPATPASEADSAVEEVVSD